jgi:predicted nuclease with TOPRIM domain
LDRYTDSSVILSAGEAILDFFSRLLQRHADSRIRGKLSRILVVARRLLADRPQKAGPSSAYRDGDLDKASQELSELARERQALIDEVSRLNQRLSVLLDDLDALRERVSSKCQN